MNICHFLTLNNWGGVETSLMDFITFFSNKHLTHYVVSTSIHPQIRKFLSKNGIDFLHVTSKFRYDPTKLLSIRQYISNNQIDILHSYNAPSNSWANLSLFLTRISPKFIAHERGAVWDTAGMIQLLEKFAYERADLVLANSNASKLMLQYKYGISASRIRVIYNGIQLTSPLSQSEARKQLGLPSGTLVVGSVGRLDPVKDYGTFVDIAEIVLRKSRNVVFILIGDGKQSIILRNMVKEKGIEDRFRFAGMIPEARNLISAFDLYLNTSVRESFGNSLVEAALHGVPVVAPAIDGIPEVVIDGETGVLVKPTLPIRKLKEHKATNFTIHNNILVPARALNPLEVAEKILDLLDNPSYRARLGETAKERATTMFSMKNYCDNLEMIYFEVIQ